VNTLISNRGISGNAINIDNDYNVTLSDVSISAANVKIVNNDTSGTINISAATTITSSTMADVLEIVQNTGSTFTTNANYAVTISDASLSAANVKLINADNGTGTIDISAATTITSSTIADVLEIVNNTGSVFTTAADYVVTLSDTSASAANLNTINADTTGLVTATSVTTISSSAVSDVLTLISNRGISGDKINLATNYAVTLSDTSASAADIKTINGDNGTGAINMATVTTITSSTMADVLEIVQNTGSTFTTNANYAVTISDASLSAANVKLINADNGTGTIDISAATTITSSTIADVLEIVNNTGSVFTTAADYVVTLSDSGTVNAASILAIDNDTTGIVTINNATFITGTLADLNAIYNSTGISGLGNENISITNTGTITATQVNDLLGETSGTITFVGSGNLAITMTSNDTLNLSGITNSLSGNLSITDSTGNENIIGTSANDTLTLSSGNDTVNLGDGSDVINVTIGNLDISDNISDNGVSGTDTLNITDSGTIDSANLIDVSGIETLNLSGGNDTITFDDTAEFNAFRNEFTNIVDAGGNDTLSFGTTAVTGDLDFSNLSEFENLNLSSANDNLTISGDEPTNINGLDGNDTFSLDFSNVNNFTINGGNNSAGDDKVNITGTSSSISIDTNIFGAGAFDNIEALDLTATNLIVGANTSDGGANAEYTLTGSLINSWTSSGSLKLTLDADAASKFEFTNSIGTKFGGDDSGTTAITNGSYTLDSGATLIVDGL
jgi:transposase-like protein